VLSNELPANQIALASTFKAIARGRPKTLKQHLIDAEMVMSELRERGFRLVPFPPLKDRRKKGPSSRKFR
jgi:hypothetical protein